MKFLKVEWLMIFHICMPMCHSSRQLESLMEVWKFGTLDGGLLLGPMNKFIL